MSEPFAIVHAGVRKTSATDVEVHVECRASDRVYVVLVEWLGYDRVSVESWSDDDGVARKPSDAPASEVQAVVRFMDTPKALLRIRDTRADAHVDEYDHA